MDTYIICPSGYIYNMNGIIRTYIILYNNMYTYLQFSQPRSNFNVSVVLSWRVSPSSVNWSPKATSRVSRLRFFRRHWSSQKVGLISPYHPLIFAKESNPTPKTASLRFMHRHADSDLMAILQSSVPPPDVGAIDLFRSHLSKYHQKAMQLMLSRSNLIASISHINFYFRI